MHYVDCSIGGSHGLRVRELSKVVGLSLRPADFHFQLYLDLVLFHRMKGCSDEHCNQ